jgi:hypothetical protein
VVERSELPGNVYAPRNGKVFTNITVRQFENKVLNRLPLNNSTAGR